VQPLDALVRQMNVVSSLLKDLLVAQRIFVSRRAAGYFKLHRKGGVLIHPNKPFVTAKDFS
jgi:hypothetical protein